MYFKYRKECFCGNSYGSQGKSTSCTMKCDGNDQEICGGPGANNIYSLKSIDYLMILALN